MSRYAIAILSKENLIHNLSVVENIAPQSKIIAMVKANAYGHGIRSVSKILDNRVAALGVASIDEALSLRKAGISGRIVLIEGVNDIDELLIAAVEKFEVVIHSFYQVQHFHQIQLPCKIPCWLKIDTGMGRLGFDCLYKNNISDSLTGLIDDCRKYRDCNSDAEIAYRMLIDCKYVDKPLGIMSHFASANSISEQLNQIQLQNFRDFIKNKEAIISFANSAAILNFPESHYNYVRPGIILYGVSPIDGTSGAAYHLRPVMTMRTKIIAIRDKKKGDNVGYSCKYTCHDNMQIGIIAFGYGDGYPTSMIAKCDGSENDLLQPEPNYTIVNGSKCPIVGRVSMDMMAIDLRLCANPKIHDDVILWGDELPIEKIADNAGVIPWSLMAGVQHRVKFLWK